MDITVNGTGRSVPEGVSVHWLVTELLGRSPAGVAVAVNGAVIARGSWGERAMSAGDRVEVVAALQGG